MTGYRGRPAAWKLLYESGSVGRAHSARFRHQQLHGAYCRARHRPAPFNTGQFYDRRGGRGAVVRDHGRSHPVAAGRPSLAACRRSGVHHRNVVVLRRVDPWPGIGRRAPRRQLPGVRDHRRAIARNLSVCHPVGGNGPRHAWGMDRRSQRAQGRRGGANRRGRAPPHHHDYVGCDPGPQQRNHDGPEAPRSMGQCNRSSRSASSALPCCWRS